MQPKTKLDTECLIKLLAKAISEKYNTKPTAPSLVISWLGKEWYVSVVCYHGSFGRDKEVITSTQGIDLNKMLIEISQGIILSTWKPSDIDNLKYLIENQPIHLH